MARAELLRLGAGSVRAQALATDGAPAVAPGPGEALLATWHELLDAGRGQDGDENLAGTAKPARAALSAATAAAIGAVEGGQVTISTDRGSVTVPAVVTDMLDGVVWLPTNARGCAARATLGAGAATIVRIASAEGGSS